MFPRSSRSSFGWILVVMLLLLAGSTQAQGYNCATKTITKFSKTTTVTKTSTTWRPTKTTITTTITTISTKTNPTRTVVSTLTRTGPTVTFTRPASTIVRTSSVTYTIARSTSTLTKTLPGSITTIIGPGSISTTTITRPGTTSITTVTGPGATSTTTILSTLTTVSVSTLTSTLSVPTTKTITTTITPSSPAPTCGQYLVDPGVESGTADAWLKFAAPGAKFEAIPFSSVPVKGNTSPPPNPGAFIGVFTFDPTYSPGQPIIISQYVPVPASCPRGSGPQLRFYHTTDNACTIEARIDNGSGYSVPWLNVFNDQFPATHAGDWGWGQFVGAQFRMDSAYAAFSNNVALFSFRLTCASREPFYIEFGGLFM